MCLDVHMNSNAHEATIQITSGNRPFRPSCTCGAIFIAVKTESAAKSLITRHHNTVKGA